ncbi:MAG: maleylpyruvate isomerase family mycothiol-dependent enzyme [Dermatophilaceae bacterium]
MPTSPTLLTFEEYGAGIGAAATVLRANATSAHLDARVPTCPEWTVTDLVAHTGMVHRWCADTLRGTRSDPLDHEAAGRASGDLLQWFDDGATELLDALSKTPQEWEGFFFLRTADHPRDGWARRQCHETTVHAVDAISARLGRPPTAAEVWFSTELAVDGIDELLTGFVPRRSSPLRSPQPVTIEVAATDADATWCLRVSEEPTVVRRGTAEDPDARWAGPARDLYLALWNRAGDGTGGAVECAEITAAGSGSRSLWADLMRVTWS